MTSTMMGQLKSESDLNRFGKHTVIVRAIFQGRWWVAVLKVSSTKPPRVVSGPPLLWRGLYVELARKTVVTSFGGWRGRDLELQGLAAPTFHSDDCPDQSSQPFHGGQIQAGVHLVIVEDTYLL